MTSYLRKKYWVRLQYGFWLGFLLIFASTVRIVLIGLGWPITNSDEATMGLMAMHIAFRGEHPVFFYGQSYMGSLEAYPAAVLFRLFGPSSFTLRLGLVLLFALFLLILYLLTSLLYTKKYALLSIALLCFGSIEMLTRQLKAIGGYPETLLFGSLMLLLATYLALSYNQRDMTRSKYARSFLYWLLGCSIGAGIWSNMLVLPFVGVPLLLLFLFCRYEWRTRMTLFLLLGLLLGLLPLLIFNVAYPLQNSIVALWQLHASGGTSASMHVSLWDHLLGTVVISLPMATGAPSICPISTLPGYWREQLSGCMVVQGIWGLVFLCLWLLAGLLTIKKLKEIYYPVVMPRSFDEQRNLVVYTARLMILVSAGLTLLSFALSPASALVPATASRYLIGLLVAFPAILAPLWEPLQNCIAPSGIDKTLLLRKTGFLLIGVLLIYSTLGVFQQVTSVEVSSQQRRVFIADLLRVHIIHIYSDYWTCNDVIFQSGERIICSVIDDDFQPGQNRYIPYSSIVQQDPQAAYVFHIGSPQATLLSQKVGLLKKQYSNLIIDGYVVYQPQG